MSASARSPRVTVFIPVYNRAHHIADAIRSVLAQTFTDFELLVIDDGSTDDSAARVAAIGDPRIRLVRHAENQGIPRTRNHALDLARGEYLANLDSDDLCLPERLGRQVAFLDRHADHAVLGTWGRDMDEHGRPRRGVRREPIRWPDVDVHLLFRCALRNRSVMLRTAVARALRYDDRFARCQDYELHARIARQHKLANLPEVLVHARQHPGRFTLGTFDLGRQMKLEVMAAQLRTLGIEPTDDDLARHFALWRSRHLAGGVDRAFLEWARDWLEQLRRANAAAGRYQARALDATLAGIWLKLCAEGVRRIGPGALRWLPRFTAWRRWPAALGAYRGRCDPPPDSSTTEEHRAATPPDR